MFLPTRPIHESINSQTADFVFQESSTRDVKTWNKFRRMQPFLRELHSAETASSQLPSAMDTKAAGAAIAARERASNQFVQLRSVMKPAGQLVLTVGVQLTFTLFFERKVK
jgi:hypothetical protein